MVLVVQVSWAQTRRRTTTSSRSNTTQGNNATTTAPPVATTPPVAKKKFVPKQDGYMFNSDTAITKLDSTAGKPVELPEIKREDIVYSKRIWRMIDFRDPGNAILNSPTVNLLKVINDAIAEGVLDLHAVDDESFQKEPMSGVKANGATSSAADTAFRGVNPNTQEMNNLSPEFFASAFKGIRIKEDWIFDGKRGVFEPRIVGVAPIRLDIRSQNEKGEPILGPDGQPKPEVTEQPVGWIRYEELRPILATVKIADDNNDNSGITLDDIFTKRLFYSYITKQSNSKNDRIQDLKIAGKELTSREQLLESERIKKQMADFEQGLWEY